MKNPIFLKTPNGNIEELVPNTVDASREKHVPVIVVDGNNVLISVGSEPHPMLEEHHILWIEVQNNKEIQRKYLNPGDKPEARFDISPEGLTALAYCNIHGLWSS